MKVRVWKLLGLLFVVIFVLSAAHGVYAVGVVGAPIVVGTDPNGVAYDSGKGELFVSNAENDTISVISDSTNTVIANVTLGIVPWGVAYDSGKGEIFVAGSGKVSVISDSTNTATLNVTVGSEPWGVAYDSGKSEIFVTNSGSGTVSAISDKTNTVVATIKVGSYPWGVAYDSGMGELFVTNVWFRYCFCDIGQNQHGCGNRKRGNLPVRCGL